jgi:hypothetical protein
MALNATLAIDVEQFEDGLKSAVVSLQTFEKASTNVNRDLKRLLEGFSGEKVVIEASRMAEAVERIGGASKLTETEQRRVNATVSEALAKYQALGERAPAHLVALQQATAGAVQQTSLLTKGTQLLVGLFSARAVIGMAGDVLELTGKLTDLSGKTGISTTALQTFQYTMGQSGVSLEALANGAVQLGRRLVDGDKSATAAVGALGLSLQDLIAQGPEQAFLQIGAAIAKVPNPMEQAALATALFGRAGADFLPAFSADMAEVARKAQESGAILDQDLVAAGDAAGDALTRLQGVGLALMGRLLIPMLPAVEAVANWLGTALPSALNTARSAVDGLIRKGLELQSWLYDTAVAIAQTVRDVPVLGRVFGQSAADVEELRREAQHARDALNSFNAQGVKPATDAVRTIVPLTTNFGQALERTGRAARETGQAIANEFIGPLEEQGGLLTRSLADTSKLSQQLEAWARVNSAVLAPSIREVNAALEEQTPLLYEELNIFAQLPGAVTESTTEAGEGITGFFEQVFGGADTLGSSITSIFQSAFTGGGGALGAVQTFATGALSNLLGMIPGIGQWASAFAGPIVAMFDGLIRKSGEFFRSLFGGPSGAELNDRNLVREWEDDVLEAFGSAEDGGERWERVLNAANAALADNGYTAEQIRSIIERLWASSQEGGEETWRVIDELNRMMQRSGEAGAEAAETIADALRDLPKSVTIPIHFEVDDLPNVEGGGEGYTKGTLGVHGSYFRNFGRGTPAVLHGEEAVVRKDQALPFAQQVLAASVRPGGRSSAPASGGSDPLIPQLLAAIRTLPMDMKLAVREAMAMA